MQFSESKRASDDCTRWYYTVYQVKWVECSTAKGKQSVDVVWNEEEEANGGSAYIRSYVRWLHKILRKLLLSVPSRRAPRRLYPKGLSVIIHLNKYGMENFSLQLSPFTPITRLITCYSADSSPICRQSSFPCKKTHITIVNYWHSLSYQGLGSDNQSPHLQLHSQAHNDLKNE